ncbi:MAG: type II toxin-antitoxin system VapC family toxin [Deltaproteobacteria bacterium]
MAGLLVKVVIDTSVYIPFINKGTSHPLLGLGQGVPLFYMSAVVIEELYAGASDDASIKLLDNLYKTFDSAGRLIVPDASDWQKTGRIVAELGSKYGFEDIFLARITNDILIALSARKIGAVVVTHNTKDFLKIKEFVDFKIHE